MKDEIGKLKEIVRIAERVDQETERQGDPANFDIMAISVEPRFEDGFMVLLKANMRRGREKDSIKISGDKETSRQSDAGGQKTDLETRSQGDKQVSLSLPIFSSPNISVSMPESPNLPISRSFDAPVVQVRELVRRFGNFVAVDHVTFEVQRGEIFGLLGPNGAGKTTTFRMLCGLLPANEGTLRVAGADLRRTRASARQHIGYVAQKFSLYGQLSVSENLEFFAGAYNLRGTQKSRRIEWALQQFELSALANLPSGNLPGGFKQRLAMAAALLHEPETLFLDEPTSGADPWPVAISGGALPHSPREE